METAQSIVAGAAEKSPDGSCNVVVIDMKMFSRRGAIYAADGAPPILFGQHSLVLTALHSVMLLALILSVASRVFGVAFALFSGGISKVLTSPRIVSSQRAHFALAIQAIVKSLVMVKLGVWLGLFTKRAAFRSGWRLVTRGSHLRSVDARSRARLALGRPTIRVAFVGVEVLSRFRRLASPAGFVHRGSAFAMAE